MKVKRWIELTVVYPVLAICLLGTVALVRGPFGHCCPRINANETAAVATLRNLASAQLQFQVRMAVDLDGDDRGEFGSFRELSAGGYLRAGPGLKRLDPPVMSGAFKRPNAAGEVTRSGYLFRILLPQRGGGWVIADTSDLGRADTDGAETRWCAYARPIPGGRDIRTFFIDVGGEVLATNRKAPLPLDRPPDVEAHGWTLVR